MNEDQQWGAVLARDAASDGQFVYAVLSTGIFCRPSCPSRRPRREQVRFFSQPEAAQRAGFRPCLRCEPTAPQARGAHARLAERVCRYIDAHPDEQLTLAALGEAVGLSPNHLQRSFKRAMGISPREYAAARRVEGLKAQLREGRDVTGALYEAGYGSSSRLYEQSDERLGMTPAAYRRRGEQMQIDYTTVESPLGRMLIAATERGVCAVSLGDDDAALERGLRDEYPAAQIGRDDAALRVWVEPVLARVEGPGPHPDLPLDVRASAFQQRVWHELRAIPWGSTRSYGELAQALGQPNAARAVARACATNPVAIVNPCHRVVAADGGLSGYRWGAERKRALLEREAAGDR
jgi:AraC family transcriptional regulator of adaptative response/methylated-DNA-[protein]-cysteine methyltransferase